jgi:hypothetical protein
MYYSKKRIVGVRSLSSDQISGFAVFPKRWIVERTIAWLNRCRRLALARAHLHARMHVASCWRRVHHRDRHQHAIP